jgi:hypothetical protein
MEKIYFEMKPSNYNAGNGFHIHQFVAGIDLIGAETEGTARQFPTDKTKMKQNQTEISKTGYGNLPERMSSGTKIVIGKHTVELVRAGKADDDCPCYRIRHQINLVGNQIFTVDELNVMGGKLK